MISLLLSVVACEKDDATTDEMLKNRQLVITDNLLSENFVGNGAQWGGYDMVPSWLGTKTLSEQDWNTLYQRLDFMRPPFLRIMISDGGAYNVNGSYNETEKTTSLFKMLDYAQSRGIEISFGEWGHKSIGSLDNVDMNWIANSVKFLNYLVHTKGYSCIKTVNIINEPNGYWASTQGSYDIWKDVQLNYINEMAKYELSHLKFMGPDIAIFNNVTNTEWLTKATDHLGNNLGLYDIHVYPKQEIVHNGDYTKMLKAYKDVIPAGQRIVLGEIGFKYDEVDAELKAENEQAIANDPFAGDDSNMMIYKAFYGIDMADALIQSMRAGLSGALVWNLDDAMYNSPDNGNYQTDKLKRWGFWNILGEEHCGTPEDEVIRPFFYPVSLLCRYFPAGSEIYNIEIPNKKGVRAIMGKKGDQYTIAIVNSHYRAYDISLQSDFITNTPMKMYSYKSNSDGSFEGTVDENGFAIPVESSKEMDFSNGEEIDLQGQSFILFTNVE